MTSRRLGREFLRGPSGGWDPAAAGSRAGHGMHCNGSDRRQRRKQEAAVGAVASKLQAQAWQMLGATTRLGVRGESSQPKHP